MKISKSFRLSPEAAAVLAKQDNASQFLENLILGNTPQKSHQESQPKIPWGNLEKRIDDLQAEVLREMEAISKMSPLNVPAKNISSATPMDYGATMSRVEELRKEAAELINENQDPEDQREIQSEYQQRIDNVWDAYHRSKNER